MKAHVENDWYMQRVRVWIVDDTRRHLIRWGESGMEWHKRDEGAEMGEPTFTMSEEMWEAVATFVRDEPYGTPTRDAITDARATRDRLLSMIEKRGLR